MSSPYLALADLFYIVRHLSHRRTRNRTDGGKQRHHSADRWTEPVHPFHECSDVLLSTPLTFGLIILPPRVRLERDSNPATHPGPDPLQRCAAILIAFKAHMLRLLYIAIVHVSLDHLRLERSGELALLSLFVPGGGL